MTVKLPPFSPALFQGHIPAHRSHRFHTPTSQLRILPTSLCRHIMASTSCKEPHVFESNNDGFTSRIISWINAVEPSKMSPESMATRTTRKKSRSPKPYTRPAAEAPHESRGSSTDGSPVSVLPDPRQHILNLRNASRIDRTLRSLPHPSDNPLVSRLMRVTLYRAGIPIKYRADFDAFLGNQITHCPDDLQEEYSRIVLLYNTVEEKKRTIELCWLKRPSAATMKDLDNIESASQRIINAAQYIVDFAYSLRIDIDFKTIFLQYRSPPPKPKTGSERRRFSMTV